MPADLCSRIRIPVNNNYYDGRAAGNRQAAHTCDKSLRRCDRQVHRDMDSHSDTGSKCKGCSYRFGICISDRDDTGSDRAEKVQRSEVRRGCGCQETADIVSRDGTDRTAAVQAFVHADGQQQHLDRDIDICRSRGVRTDDTEDEGNKP